MNASRLKSLAATIFVCLALATQAFAGVPQTINYQGYLKETVSGVPASGPTDITFSLYDVATGGTPLWTEIHAAVKVSSGIYSVRLGSVDPDANPLNRPFDKEYFLGITVNSGAEMTPRQALTAVPYAMKAASADRLTQLCTQGDFLHCYTGDMTTMGTGPCRAGNRICLPAGDRFSEVCAGEIVPGQEVCDNIDNDCDGAIDNKIVPSGCYSGPADTLNVGTCTSGLHSCSAGQWSICTGEVVPASESCDNKDNDCNGIVDAFSEPCYTGPAGTQDIGICKAGTRTCTTGIFGSCLGEILPATESCGNAVDDNCNGEVNEENASGCTFYRKDADQDGYGISTDTKCLCAPAGMYRAVNSGQSDCNDNNASVNPGQTEKCSTPYDDNCNTQINEPGASDCTVYYLDNDRDGYGTSASQCLCAPSAPYDSLFSTDCNDTNAAIRPGATEVCDGIDNNCNIYVDAVDVPINTLCPPTVNVSATTCGGASGCSIIACAASWYNMDSIYSNGCEAQEDSYDSSGQGESCVSSASLGLIVSGQTRNISANIIPNGDVDWYSASVSGTTRFDVRFITNPGAAYRFDIYQSNCSSLIVSDVSTYSLLTTPTTYYIKVYRPSGPSAENYALSVSNNVY